MLRAYGNVAKWLRLYHDSSGTAGRPQSKETQADEPVAPITAGCVQVCPYRRHEAVETSSRRRIRDSLKNPLLQRLRARAATERKPPILSEPRSVTPLPGVSWTLPA